MAYTFKQINKALSLFDKLENSTLVSRQLGYLSVSILYSWIRKRRKNNGVFPDFESRKRHKVTCTETTFEKKYTPEEKIQILRRCFEGKEFVRNVADELNLTTAAIYKWRRFLLNKGAAGLVSKKLNKIP